MQIFLSYFSYVLPFLSIHLQNMLLFRWKDGFLVLNFTYFIFKQRGILYLITM